MKKLTLTFAVAVSAVVGAWQAQAAETIPASCLSGTGKTGYDTGYSAQTQVLESLWTSFGSDCSQFKNFQEGANMDLTRDPPAVEFLRCRRVGMMQALTDFIQDLNVQCNSVCAQDLGPYEDQAAKSFCGSASVESAMAAVNASRAANPHRCTSQQVTSCKQSVVTKAKARCAAFAEEHAERLTSFVAKACELSTEGGRQ